LYPSGGTRSSITEANVPTNGVIKWFQFGGDTYIVEDISTATAFSPAADLVVKLTGTIDLSTASLNTGSGPTLLLG
jgi:S-layer protein